MKALGLRLAVGLVLLLAGSAAADKADALFKKGKKQLAEKKYPEACATFEKVDKLDPGIGAKLNVARCYEEWGRVATAWQWYTDAHKLALSEHDERADKIKSLLDEVDTNVPRVMIKIPKGADPATIEKLSLDGAILDVRTIGNEQRVDPGPHVIAYTVEGVTKKKMAPVERGGSSEVMLEIPKPTIARTGDTARPKQIEHVSAPAAPGHTQRIAGVVIGGAGLVTVGIAGAMTLSAKGKYSDALAAHCMGSTAMCDPQGLKITHDARHTANTATVVTLVGAAALVGGVILYLVAPSKVERTEDQALYVAPSISADGAAVVFGGRY